MSDQDQDTTATQLSELHKLVRDAKLLGAARTLSLPLAAIGSLSALAFGPISVALATGLASAFIGIGRSYLGHQKERAFALAYELHAKGAISDLDYEDFQRTLRQATEGNSVFATRNPGSPKSPDDKKEVQE